MAGRRWIVEDGFQTGKGLCGLDQHQVRRWTSWHRWTNLYVLAHAFLAVLTATERSTRSDQDGVIPMTCNEIQHLFNTLIAIPTRTRRHCLRGHIGADDTNTTPEPATTADATVTSHEDHDLQLQYSGAGVPSREQ